MPEWIHFRVAELMVRFQDRYPALRLAPQRSTVLAALAERHEADLAEGANRREADAKTRERCARWSRRVA